MKKQNTKHNKKQVTILSTLSAEASHPKVSVTRHVKPSVQISYRAPLQNKQPQPQNEGSMLPSFVDETQADNDKIELDRRRRKQNRIVKTINKSKQTSNSQNPKLKKGLPTTTDVHKVTTSNAEEKSSKNLFRILDVQASSANYFTKIHNIKERPQSSDRRTHLEPDNTVPPGQLLEHVVALLVKTISFSTQSAGLLVLPPFRVIHFLLVCPALIVEREAAFGEYNRNLVL
ncbi:unnamed protein product [Timema podura]|uniref:Uncharacterized protein n=1 Tax=Timema podura TaxID=61482 RepID=A0ABN7P1Q5_TIMPD|nr:unnamed protein product [Timema podura]